MAGNWSEMSEDQRNQVRLQRRGSKMGDCQECDRKNVVIVTFDGIGGKWVCLRCERDMIGYP